MTFEEELLDSQSVVFLEARIPFHVRLKDRFLMPVLGIVSGSTARHPINDVNMP